MTQPQLVNMGYKSQQDRSLWQKPSSFSLGRIRADSSHRVQVKPKNLQDLRMKGVVLVGLLAAVLTNGQSGEDIFLFASHAIWRKEGTIYDFVKSDCFLKMHHSDLFLSITLTASQLNWLNAMLYTLMFCCVAILYHFLFCQWHRNQVTMNVMSHSYFSSRLHINYRFCTVLILYFPDIFWYIVSLDLEH